MADAAHRKTDEYIAEMEKKVQKEFNQARKETQRKLNRYMETIAKQAEEQRLRFEAGEISEKDYQDWMIRKAAMGKRWEELRDNLAQDMNNANRIARSIANGYRPDVYAVNHNFAIYQCEHDGRCSTVYQLYDRHTVERLLREDQDLMPPPGKKMAKAIREGRAAKWNAQNLQSAMTQSILQGESITDVAARVAATVATRNMADTIRYARTMMTGAQNAGRQDGYKHAEDLGIKLQKEWIATIDDRTRESHRELHGERVPVDEEFSNGLRYPADPAGADEEVWNCRCTMKGAIQGFDRNRVEYSPKMHDMTFEEWQHAKAIPDTQADRDQYADYKNLLGKDAPTSYQEFRDLKYYDAEAWEELKRKAREGRKK